MRSLSLLLAALPLATAPSLAQDNAPLSPLQPSDTSSPRATLTSFLAACNEFANLLESHGETEDFGRFLPAAERMRDCLDLQALPPDLRDSVGLEAAVYLKEVLDRIPLPADAELPVAADAAALDRWRIPGSRLTITRDPAGPQPDAYLFSGETVRNASKFYTVAKSLPYRAIGPPVSPDLRQRLIALTKREPSLAADTSSPRGTLKLFLDSTDKIYEYATGDGGFNRFDPRVIGLAQQAIDCLDLTQIPEYARLDFAREAAVCLREILDRVDIPSTEAIPGPEDLEAAEGETAATRWQLPRTEITITRITEGPRRGEYLFSSETVNSATRLYARYKGQPYRKDGRPIAAGFYEYWLHIPANPVLAAWVQASPAWVRSRAFGLAVWQWVGLIISILVAFTVMFTIYRIGRHRSERNRQGNLLGYWLTILFAIAAFLIPLLFKRVVFEYLTLRGTALYVTNFIADLVFLLALIVLILSLSNRIAASVVAWPRMSVSRVDANLIRIVCRVLGLITAAVVFLEGGRYLGFPITTLLASAGIGGLAIALAAQGMLKGLFGTVTLLLDRPFREGERIAIKQFDGIVEEIGLRSTKIREFLTGHLITIPNDQVADAEIENIGRRRNIRRMTDLHLPIDTPREKVAQAVELIRAALAEHEGMDPEFPPRVYFNEFNPDSFNIRMYYWYAPAELWEFHRFSEWLNLEICRQFEAHGIQFSLPLRHSYWREDDRQGPLDVHVTRIRPPRDSNEVDRK